MLRRHGLGLLSHGLHQLEADGSLLPVDSDTAVAPSIKRTWFLSLVTGLLRKVARRDGATIEGGLGQDAAASEEESDDVSGASSEVPRSGTTTPREGNGAGGTKNGRAAATSMAGGRRRKAVKRK